MPTTCIVVDDEPLIARLLRERISEILTGWHVVSETACARALALIEADDAREIAVVFADLSMPGIGGEELIVQTLAHRPDLRGRIVVCTGGVTTFRQEDRLFRELGCARLDKPFMTEELRSVLRLVAPGG